MSSPKVKRRMRRRNYSEAFKKDAVSTYEASDKSYSEICKLLDISCGSILKRWCVLYGWHKKALNRTQSMAANHISSPSSHSPERVQDKERITVLEAEVKKLKQALGTHAAKEYLSDLREASWQEISPSGSAKKVDHLVSKKL